MKHFRRGIACLAFFLMLLQPISSVEAAGTSMIVMDRSTGRILYEKNSQEVLPMASTTKIMTALLAIENTLIDHVVQVPSGAVGIEGSSIYLQANERISMVDLLYGLMLRSGNDAATAVALEIGGSIEHFSALMNQRAKELGAKQTNFMNPHGLHHQDHYTTAYDLALITRAALQKPLFRQIVSTQYWQADRQTYNHFVNKNKTLSLCEGGDGVKTGFTTRSGRCLVSSATRDGMQLIAVTLNDPDWFVTTQELMDEVFEAFLPYVAMTPETSAGQIAILDGKENSIPVQVKNPVIIPLQEEEIPQLRTVVEPVASLTAPVIKGQPAGTVYFYLGEELLAEAALVAGQSVARLTWQDKLGAFFGRRQ